MVVAWSARAGWCASRPVVVGVDGSRGVVPRAGPGGGAGPPPSVGTLRLVHAYGGPGRAALPSSWPRRAPRWARGPARGARRRRGYARSGRGGRRRTTRRRSWACCPGRRGAGRCGTSRAPRPGRSSSARAGTAGVTGLLLGSVAVPLSAHAACPVVVVRGADVAGARARRPGRRRCRRLRHLEAARSASPWPRPRASGCPLAAVMAWEELWIGAPGARPPSCPRPRELQEDARPHGVGDAGRGGGGQHPDVRVTRVVERGRPAHVLLREAVGARLVVVGSRGRGGFAGLLLGSTSQTPAAPQPGRRRGRPPLLSRRRVRRAGVRAAPGGARAVRLSPGRSRPRRRRCGRGPGSTRRTARSRCRSRRSGTGRTGASSSVVTPSSRPPASSLLARIAASRNSTPIVAVGDALGRVADPAAPVDDLAGAVGQVEGLDVPHVLAGDALVHVVRRPRRGCRRRPGRRGPGPGAARAAARSGSPRCCRRPRPPPSAKRHAATATTP